MSVMRQRFIRGHNAYPQLLRVRPITDRQAEELVAPQDEENGLNDIVKRTWKLHTLSPLYDFKYEDLGKYSNLLSAHIEAMKQKGFGFLVNTTYKWKSVFSQFRGMQYQLENPEAVEIGVTFRTEQGTIKNIFTGILCCCYGSAIPKRLQHNRLTVFPLLMTRGNEAIRKVVISFLEESFDCSICPLLINHGELQWIFSLWPTADNRRGLQSVSHLIYSTQDGKNLKSIRFSMETNGLLTLWNSIRDENSDNLSYEEMQTFMQRLEDHFTSTININPASFLLTEVRTPALMVHTKGKIKVLREDYVLRLLQHVTEISMRVYAVLDY